MNEHFRKFASFISRWAGSPWTFALALLILLIWGITGPFFGFSDTWQLVINTGTTIVTFLMVFLIQNTQNRDSRAINLKLDELIRVIREARDDMIDLENISDDELDKVERQFQQVIKRYRKSQ